MLKNEGGKISMGKISINQAMKAMKNEQCCECGRKAKGLVYRGDAVLYYCKKCLHRYTEQREQQVEEVAVG
jgi:tRNA(Ile2) C34 agmatinyltransferase TiaS